RKLVTTMRHIVIGELDERGELPKGLGEIDELTGIFDLITVRLKEAYGKTEEKVKARTVELEFNKGMAELEKARIEALLASIGEGVVATDREGKIIFFNKFAADLIGVGTDLVGKSIFNAMTLQDEKGVAIDADARPTHKALSTGKRVESPLPPKPLWMSRSGAKPFPVHIVVTPVIHDTETIGAVAVFRDITDEMEVDRRKSEFISIASHQLRSPLTGIKWLTDMLRKGDLGKLQDKQQKVADQIFDANERLVTLVNELLNVSRLEVGTTKPNPVQTDMTKLMQDAVADFQPVLAAKQQKLAYDAGALPSIMVDPLLTREVVANILSNASKYSPDGSTVTLTATQEGGEFHISVADQGIGIPPSDQKKMFQKFFRAENAAKSSITGTGLGLYVVKSVVELQGGRIWFESDVGKGTTFHVTFPLTPPKAAPATA
ncbi:MAG TPA: ATP-binding protein, partial [Patescibacteria group bacterium]|nr:ATP-binding protein [Patescibacteria group bacterium]